jgi:hypothetical protein
MGELMMWTNPIIEELHEVRRQIAAEHGDDIQALGRHYMERQKAHADRLVSFPPRRPEGWVEAAPVQNTASLAQKQ